MKNTASPSLKDEIMLVEVLDRVLNKGVVITGDLTIAVADVDLLYCGVRILLTSVENIARIQENSSATFHRTDTT